MAGQIRIGNAAGFWGDNLDAPVRLADAGQLDYLTLEYLAELTLSILAHQRSKHSEAGYVTDVPLVVGQLARHFRGTSPLRLITNGGGMNPSGCARAAADVLVGCGLPEVRIAAVAGDDLLPQLDQLIAAGESFPHFDDGTPLGPLRARIASANVYLGAAGIVDALRQDAHIVLTGRVADASLVVGPAVHEFGWQWSDVERLGGATVAGHLIECGAQVTGGMYSDWQPEMSLADIGYPIAVLRSDGSCQITKPAGSGGHVSVGTVAEQLVYEIGDPARYLTPDVVADFRHVRLQPLGDDRVEVSGGTGTAAPETYKVSMAYDDGFATSGTLVVTGPNAVAKAKICAETIRQRVAQGGYELDRFAYECLGAGDTLPGLELWRRDVAEVTLRVAAWDPRREAIERLTREFAPLVTAGPPGVTGYTGPRSRARPVLAYWPSRIARHHVKATVDVRSAREWLK